MLVIYRKWKAKRGRPSLRIPSVSYIGGSMSTITTGIEGLIRDHGGAVGDGVPYFLQDLWICGVPHTIKGKCALSWFGAGTSRIPCKSQKKIAAFTHTKKGK